MSEENKSFWIFVGIAAIVIILALIIGGYPNSADPQCSLIGNC